MRCRSLLLGLQGLQLSFGSARALSSRGLATAANPKGPPAFVFDIDGVLIRGKTVLPAAIEAVQQLYTAGAWKYPVCFLTNGGGVLESVKAQQLTSWLGVPVSSDQVVLSHTPMRSLVPRLADAPVLVSGLHNVMAVAREYGFRKVLSTGQLAAALPAAVPFLEPAEAAASAGSAAGLAGRCVVRDLGWGTEADPIRAVLVMTDPSDWYRDLQLIIDVVTGAGVPQRHIATHGPAGVPHPPPVELYFSNPDLLWANDFAKPRFGQGAFSLALQALHRELTGHALPHATWFGKPNRDPYRLIEQLLLRQAVRMGHTLGNGSDSGHVRQVFSGIYAVGDNPAADVRGANRAGEPWVSVLVRTGVFQGSAGTNCTTDPAQVVVNDVAGAVTAALHRTRTHKWHSIR